MIISLYLVGPYFQAQFIRSKIYAIPATYNIEYLHTLDGKSHLPFF